MKTKEKKTGPKPDALKIEGDWESAMGKAVKKEKPKEGWPEPNKKGANRPKDRNA